MLDNFIPMATYRGDEGWLSWWTVFFWGWFLGYGPMMAIFIARISRGRTIRQVISTISIVAPLTTCFWFTIVGGSGLAFEIADPGSVSTAFEGFNLPGALLAVTQQLPMPMLTSILFLILTTIFIVTTGDSMTYTISVVISGETEPNAIIRTFGGNDGCHGTDSDFSWLWWHLCTAIFHCDNRGSGVADFVAITLECATNRNQYGERARVITIR